MLTFNSYDAGVLGGVKIRTHSDKLWEYDTCGSSLFTFTHYSQYPTGAFVIPMIASSYTLAATVCSLFVSVSSILYSHGSSGIQVSGVHEPPRRFVALVSDRTTCCSPALWARPRIRPAICTHTTPQDRRRSSSGRRL